MGWLSVLGIVSRQDRDAARAALAEVDIGHLWHRRVDQLSGGERQRLGVARVMAREAELVLPTNR